MIVGLCLLAYLLGSIPSGFLLVKVRRGLDVRQFGSHNVGAINVFRVGGPGLGVATLAADSGKGLLVVVGAWALTHQPAEVALAAFSCLVGHAYSLFFLIVDGRFSEGKAVATSLGIYIGLCAIHAIPIWPVLCLISLWMLILAVPRAVTGQWPWISIATMGTVALSAPMAWQCARDPSYRVLAIATACLILVRHKNNVRRLLGGTEPRPGAASKRIII